MRRSALLSTLAVVLAAPTPSAAQDMGVLTGEAAFGDWSTDAPGVRRLITPADLPEPFASEPTIGRGDVVPRPVDAVPRVPEGFNAELLAEGLERPRTLRVAPNGDIFVAESGAGGVLVLRRNENGSIERSAFADGFGYPYGIAFYPPGLSPEWVYVAETTRIVRFPCSAGDLIASGPAEGVLAGIPGGGHSTRDIAFTPDGDELLVAVGSLSNVADGIGSLPPDEIARLEIALGIGAAWGAELGRASVMSFDSKGRKGKSYSNGIRNCSGLTIQPATGDLWCATNERDGLGDNLPPDYVSRIVRGAFYGWPWYYTGNNEDPRHAGARPDLMRKVTIPDVLLQPHSAPLSIVFYEGDAFPEEYHGDGFAALHGSWNRGALTGYKVVRIIIGDDRMPTGEYEDFMTGFVLDDESVRGRPVGVAVAVDGALLVSEDGNGTIWRVHAKP